LTDWDRVYGYDIETYPNLFCIAIVHMTTGTRWIFEVSHRTNQSADLVLFLRQLRDAGCRMLGFNNVHFDYVVLHDLVDQVNRDGYATVEAIYAKSQAIFAAQRNDWSQNVWESDHVVPQIDIFKIMHFDNMAKATSLKKLQIAMRSWSVQDLPYPPGSILTVPEMDHTISYMCHDVSETLKFAWTIKENIQFRDELTAKYQKNFTNFNDTKIGKQHFIDQIEQSGVACYERGAGGRKPRQTPRLNGIKVVEKLLPVPFETADLQRMWNFFAAAVIPAHMTKGFFTSLTADLRGFELVFGAGGIHGSVNRQTFVSDDDHVVIDVDVTSYYPSLAIVNRWYPDHLGSVFCDIYQRLKDQRVSYAKGTSENAMLKLALNGVYGDSNNPHSPFYDPAYTMAITINGQLQLAWLAEMTVLHVPGAVLIQVNTDGMTVRLPRSSVPMLNQVRAHWETNTRLDLESVEYAKMLVRDVNNYIAIDVKGKVKRKNAYLTAPEWHQDHSSLVIPKAVDAFVMKGTPVAQFIYDHTDPFDFMRHIKVPRSSRLLWGDDPVQGTSRYFIALAGRPLVKEMPPLAGKPGVRGIAVDVGGSTEISDVQTVKEMPPLAGTTGVRRIGVDVGWSTAICNVASDFDWTNLNRRFYIVEAEKLVAGLGIAC
jgi:hypothetical protein